MLTAQQLHSFTHLSFNSGMASTSLCYQNLHLTSVNHLPCICEQKMPVDSLEANTEPTFAIFSPVFSIFRYCKYGRWYQYQYFEISGIGSVFFGMPTQDYYISSLY